MPWFRCRWVFRKQPSVASNLGMEVHHLPELNDGAGPSEERGSTPTLAPRAPSFARQPSQINGSFSLAGLLSGIPPKGLPALSTGPNYNPHGTPGLAQHVPVPPRHVPAGHQEWEKAMEASNQERLQREAAAQQAAWMAQGRGRHAQAAGGSRGSVPGSQHSHHRQQPRYLLPSPADELSRHPRSCTLDAECLHMQGMLFELTPAADSLTFLTLPAPRKQDQGCRALRIEGQEAQVGPGFAEVGGGDPRAACAAADGNAAAAAALRAARSPTSDDPARAAGKSVVAVRCAPAFPQPAPTAATADAAAAAAAAAARLYQESAAPGCRGAQENRSEEPPCAGIHGL